MITESGVFWLPESPDKQLPGSLITEDDGRFRLEIAGEITPSLKVVAHDPATNVTQLDDADDPPHLLIHGVVLGEPNRPVSLIDCITTHRTNAWTAWGGILIQHIEPGRLAYGGHIDRDTTFTGVRVRVADIDAWAALPGFRADKLADGTIQLTFKRAELQPVTTSKGERLELCQAVTTRRHVGKDDAVSHEAWIEVSNLDDVTFRQIDASYTSPIASYISLAVGTTSPLTDLQIQCKGDPGVDDERAGEATWLTVRHRGMEPNATGSVEVHQTLLPLWATGLDLVSNFLDVYPLAGSAVPVIRDLLSNVRRMTIDTQVLELTTIAEGLHSRFFPDDERMPEADAARLRELVKEALAPENNPRYTAIVTGMGLYYLREPNYKQRLKRLADTVAEALPGVCGDQAEWVNKVDEARNSFAHSKHGFIPEDWIDDAIVVAQSLRWVLMGNIFLRAGVPAEILRDRVNQHQQYYWFLRNSRERSSIYT